MFKTGKMCDLIDSLFSHKTLVLKLRQARHTSWMHINDRSVEFDVLLREINFQLRWQGFWVSLLRKIWIVFHICQVLNVVFNWTFVIWKVWQLFLENNTHVKTHKVIKIVIWELFSYLYWLSQAQDLPWTRCLSSAAFPMTQLCCSATMLSQRCPLCWSQVVSELTAIFFMSNLHAL